MFEDYAHEAGDLVDRIKNWIDEKDMTEFNTEFIDSIEDQIEKEKPISQNQLTALENICKSWRIE